MAKGTNQKLKLYRLSQIMLEKTDEDHWITMPEILSELDKYGISAERKSIYTDLQELEELGIEVEGEQRGRLYYYHVVGREFELAELKLLVDAIQSSKFITARKSNELIRKLEKHCSEYEAKQLSRQVVVQDRIKTMNESIYYSVDGIHNAIAQNRKIQFKYFSWDIKKNAVLRRNGEFYCISPWALAWEEGNYYMVGYDSNAKMVKHYRVDKMLNISVVDEMREGKELFEHFNSADYVKKNFSMFGGEEESVMVEIENEMCGIFIDRFGKDITFIPKDEKHCTVRLKVALTSFFISWIFALGDGVKVVGPASVVERVKNEAERISKQYNSKLAD